MQEIVKCAICGKEVETLEAIEVEGLIGQICPSCWRILFAGLSGKELERIIDITNEIIEILNRKNET